MPIAIPALLKMPVTEFHTPEKKPPNRLKILVMPFHACWNMPVKKLPTVLNTFLMLDHAFVATDTIPFHMPVKKLPDVKNSLNAVTSCDTFSQKVSQINCATSTIASQFLITTIIAVITAITAAAISRNGPIAVTTPVMAGIMVPVINVDAVPIHVVIEPTKDTI